jgi:hypothetical protein
VDPAEDLLRRLALNDEAVLSRVLTPRVVAAAPKLAIAIGYDLENGHEGPE